MVQVTVITDLMEYVVSHADRGDADGVVAAIDAFVDSSNHAFMHVGPEKAALIETIISREQPRRILELGTFFGYSGIRMARGLILGGELVTIDISKRDAKVAEALFEYAGVADCITVHVADTQDILAELDPTFDLVLFDHYAGNYFRDLVTIEAADLLAPSAHLIADNVLIHEASCRDYLMRVRESGEYLSETHRVRCRHHGNSDDAIEVSRRC